MKNISITIRIMAVAVVSMFGLLVSSGYIVVSKKSMVNSMTDLQDMVHVAPVISSVVHEMQKERGSSAVYIGSSGERFSKVLATQRSDTNAALLNLEKSLEEFDTESYGGALASKMSQALNALTNLKETRGEVEALDYTTPQMAGYYTGTIAKLLSVVEEIALLSDEASITRSLVAYTSYLQLKERAGIERAVGAGGFGASRFTPDNHRKFVSLLGEQKGLVATFETMASVDLVKYNNDTVSGPVIEDVARMRQIALTSLETRNIGDVKGAYWFDQKTKEIDLMKKVEDRIVEDLLVASASFRSGALGVLTLTSVLALAAIIGISVLSVVIIKGIVGPVADITGTMGRLTDGDYSVEVPATDRGDEIGEMAKALLIFQTGLVEARRLQEEQSKAQQEELKRAEAIDKLTAEFDEGSAQALGIVASATDEMQATAASLTATAEETATQAAVVSEGADGASENVKTAAAAAEELRASIAEISGQVEHSATIANEATEEAKRSASTMGSLSDAAQGITNVVDLIQDIAAQTNLLALNATIEAARAGEAGKGFAVVASEVKSLATQTAQATEQIAQQIEAMQGVTGEAVESINSIGGIIDRINEISSSVASAVTEQSAATDDIARSVEEAAMGTQGVTENVAAVSEAAGDTSSAASQVSSASNELGLQTNSLKTRIEEFIASIKAA